MNPRLFSLCTPCPDGFSFCSEFVPRDFRIAPFALYAPSLQTALDFLGTGVERLSGVILVPGERLTTRDLTPRISCITVSPALTSYMADFAAHQLSQLEQMVRIEDRTSLLALENERLATNDRRTSEDFERFRSSLMREIEERREAERQLAEREELLRLIMSSTGESIYGIDTDGLCTFANEACLRTLGYSQIQDLLGRNMHDLIHYRKPDGSPLPVEECCIFKAFKEGTGTTVSDEFFFRSDGSSFPVEYSSYPIRKDSSIVGAVVTWRDITRRRQIEDTHNFLLTCSYNNSQDDFFNVLAKYLAETLDMDFVCIDVLGGDQLDATTLAVYYDGRFEDNVTYALKDTPCGEVAEKQVCFFGSGVRHLFPNDAVLQEMKAESYAGVTLWSSSGKPIGLIALISRKPRENLDMPIRILQMVSLRAGAELERRLVEEDRLRLEHQLQHTQKLESLGVLAGGIAHDFNNILMAIIGNADLALMRLNPESPAVENLHRIEQAAARAADLAKQMLAYSGKGKFVIEHIDLNLLVQEMLHMLEVSISKKAVLRFNFTPDIPRVEADATQMRQVIMNLVINASEAIGDKSGVIAITTGCMECDRNYLKDVWLDENLTEGLYVYLEIADTGCGMDREILSRIFDPFFTTKFTGRGLGMAAVLGIVRGHKGAIKVYSEEKKGSTFKILFPAASRPEGIFNGHRFSDEWQGSGNVLLVDDEETVRAIGSEMLRTLGFRVITAEDGREALEQFKNNPGITLVILDLTMPHLDGEQCFRELRRMNPDVRVIMSSGYNEQEVTQKFVGKGLAGFIQKPYKLSVLKDAIREVIQE